MSVTLRRKYRFKTRQAAEDAQERESIACTLNRIALNHALAGRVHWIRGQGAGAAYSAGVVSPDAPHGGIVIVGFCPGGQRDQYTAYYLDDWTTGQLDYYPTDAEGRAVRQLAAEVREYRRSVTGY